jgi:hypothetical protein
MHQIWHIIGKKAIAGPPNMHVHLVKKGALHSVLKAVCCAGPARFGLEGMDPDDELDDKSGRRKDIRAFTKLSRKPLNTQAEICLFSQNEQP